MDGTWNRREVLRLAGGALLGGVLGAGARADEPPPAKSKGRVVGQPLAAKAGEEVLAAGGNAVDAAVAAALTAGVVAVSSCGIGGYGGHMVLALAGGKKVTAIDFNSAAAAAAREDLFPLTEKGEVKGGVNVHGWLAAGVPGTLAGMQLALDRYGTLSFSKVVQPAIRHAREGFEVIANLASATKGAQAQLLKDAGSARLLLNKGEPLQQGDTFRNPDLADLLTALAEANSVEPFYRGDIARRIASAFEKNGGLVTVEDLAAYRAREVEPLEWTWGSHSIRTAPLTAGGATVIEALMILKEIGWEKRPADDPRTTQAQLEALRLAWDDRLLFFGDPEKVDVPLKRLLSEEHARELAAKVEKAIAEKKPAPTESDGRVADGTIHLSAADAQGNLVALTLTHGDAFGAQVTVDGLGLILGHSMSRFDPRPGKRNSPAPGKRPLHNMCPTVVLRDGVPVLALGATGGRRIPNTVFTVLAHCVGRGRSLEEAVAALRMQTVGDRSVTLEAKWPEAELDYLRNVGYTLKTGPGATVQALRFDPKTGESHAVSR
jgi:gamma-glutamyltranspeptidase / glutathione hydrolase